MAELRTRGILAWKSFLRVHTRVLRQLDDELQGKVGMSLTWFDVLSQLEASPQNRLRMSELADSLLLSHSGLTRRLDQMEKASLIRREICPSDRRGFYAVLTEAGRQTLSRAWPSHRLGIQNHFLRHLTHREIAVLARSFEKILEKQAERKRGNEEPASRSNPS